MQTRTEAAKGVNRVMAGSMAVARPIEDLPIRSNPDLIGLKNL